MLGWAGEKPSPAQPGPVLLQTPRRDGVIVIQAVAIVTFVLPGCWIPTSVSSLVCVFMSLNPSLELELSMNDQMSVQ